MSANDEEAERSREGLGPDASRPDHVGDTGDLGPFADRKIGKSTLVESASAPQGRPSKVGATSLVDFESGRTGRAGEAATVLGVSPEAPTRPMDFTARPARENPSAGAASAAYYASLRGDDVTGASTPGEAAFASATSGAAVQIPHRARIEQAFGADFSDVRAHVGQAAALDSVGARAVARGGAVAFGSTNPDIGLVAHELAHVQQQRQAGTTALAASRVESSPGDAAEVEADSVAAQVVAGASSVAVSAEPSATLHFARDPHAPAAPHGVHGDHGSDPTKEATGSASTLAPHQTVAAATFLGSLGDTFHGYPHPLLLPGDASEHKTVPVALISTATPPIQSVPKVTIAWKVTHPAERNVISSGITHWQPMSPLVPIGFEVWRDGTYTASLLIEVEGYGERREIVTLAARRPDVSSARALDDDAVMTERREVQDRLATEKRPTERETLQEGYSSMLWVSHERGQPSATDAPAADSKAPSLPDDPAGIRAFVERAITREGFARATLLLGQARLSLVPGLFEISMPSLFVEPVRATPHQLQLINEQLALIKTEAASIRDEFRAVAKMATLELLHQSDHQLLAALTSYGVPYPPTIHESALAIANDGSQLEIQTEALLRGAKGGSAEAGQNYAAGGDKRAALAEAARHLKRLQADVAAARHIEESYTQDRGGLHTHRRAEPGPAPAGFPHPAPASDGFPIHVEAVTAGQQDQRDPAGGSAAQRLAGARTYRRSAELILKAEWAQAEREHPILVAFREGGREHRDLSALTGGDDAMMRTALHTVLPKLGNVIKAITWLESGHLDPLKLEMVIPLAKDRMRIAPGSIRSAAVDQMAEEARGGLEAWILAAITVAMGVVMIAPTGGGSLPAAIELGGLALDTYLSVDAVNEYNVQSVATDTAMDPALALSREEPSLTWLAVQLVGTAVGAGFTAKTFREAAALRRAAQAGEASQAAIRDLNALGREGGLGDIGTRVVDEAHAGGAAERGAAHGAEAGGAATVSAHARSSDVLGGLASQNPDALARRLGTGVEVDASLGSGVMLERIVEGDEVWVVGIRVGPDTAVADVLAHQNAIALLRRYNGRLGKLRTLVDNFTGGPLGRGAMHAGTEAGHAAIELDKLRRIVGVRQAALAGHPISEVAGALEEEIAFLDDAIERASITARTGDREAVHAGEGAIASPDFVNERELAQEPGTASTTREGAAPEPRTEPDAAPGATSTHAPRPGARIVVPRTSLKISKRRTSQEWKFFIEAPLPDGQLVLIGDGKVLLDEAGNALGGPEFLFDKRAILNGEAVRIDIGDGAGGVLSLTDFGMDEGLRLFVDEFKHAPTTLPGILMYDNLENFQLGYLKALDEGLSESAALQASIRETSYGKARVARGYGKFSFKIELEEVILHGTPPVPRRVPKHVEVNAEKGG